MSKRRKFLPAIALAATTVGIIALSSGYGSAAEGCMPRYLSEKIRDMVLASKATHYCESVPYTYAQVHESLDRLRCNDEASDMIDTMLEDYEYQYKSIMLDDPTQVVCKKAATLVLF